MVEEHATAFDKFKDYLSCMVLVITKAKKILKVDDVIATIK